MNYTGPLLHKPPTKLLLISRDTEGRVGLSMQQGSNWLKVISSGADENPTTAKARVSSSMFLSITRPLHHTDIHSVDLVTFCFTISQSTIQ